MTNNGLVLYGDSLPEDTRDKLRELLKNRRARNTLKTYGATLRKWTDWAESLQLPVFPARTEDVVRYLVESNDKGTTKSTLSMFLTVMRLLHAGRIDDPTKALSVQETWKAIKRTDKRPKKKATVLSLTELTLCVEALMAEYTEQSFRDRALLTVGWSGAFRAGELVTLDWSDVRFVSKGAEIFIRSSKTDQEGEGYSIAIPYFRHNYHAVCPVRALQVLDLHKGHGFIFRRIGQDNGPLSTKAVSRIITRAVKLAGLPGKYSAHSLRRGFATWAAEQGVTDRQIMRHGRWKSRTTVDGYIQQGTLWTDNALISLLGG